MKSSNVKVCIRKYGEEADFANNWADRTKAQLEAFPREWAVRL